LKFIPLTRLRATKVQVFVCCFFGLFFLPLSALSLDTQNRPGDEDAPALAEKLWNRAVDLQRRGVRERAANTFLRVYQDFPYSPMAEDSLWQAIQYYKESAGNDRSHLETLEELYGRFAASFPESARASKINFDLGLLNYEKRFYRDALTRFQLILKKYPDSDLAGRANYLQAKTYLKLGQIKEARDLFAKYANSADKDLKAKGLAGLGEIYNREDKPEKALEIIKKSLSLSSTFYLNNPEAEVLLEMGEAYLRMGNEESGRKQLFHYLNIIGNKAGRLDVLWEIAESFHRQTREEAAQEVYERIVEEGVETEKVFLAARFRIAYYRDDPANVLSKWQRRGDLKDPAGDLPYTSLLENTFEGPLAQDARRGLFRRYQARGAFDDASNIAKIYLHQLSPEEKSPALRKAADDMLIYVIQHLAEEKRYQEVYDFYRMQHRHVVLFPDGRLLYLVGQALEALSLYDQAATVYWRALSLPLKDSDKVDLYFRRARVYLAKKDFEAAGRLLFYLRSVYENKKEVGEIYSLSGRLEEERKDKNSALKFYREAFKINTLAARRKQYINDYLRLLLELNKLTEMNKVLTSIGSGDDGLENEKLQGWFVLLAEKWQDSGDKDAAAQAYRKVLADGMPLATKEAQKAWLELGDLQARGEKQPDKGEEYYRKAAEGPDPLLKALAQERLKQIGIERSFFDLDLPDRR
jgi:tetratricopeptide (TPR) repeat protein